MKRATGTFLCVLCLSLLMAKGFHARQLHWFTSQGLHLKTENADIDGYLNLATSLIKSKWNDFLSYRPNQLLYPALLTPIPVWNLDVSSYVFWLHQLLSLGFLSVLFFIGRRLLNSWYGLVIVGIAAFEPAYVTWFNWIFTETLYYFMLSLFVWVSLIAWKKRTSVHLICLIFVSLLLFLTKPEGAIVSFASLLYFLFLFLRERLTSVKSVVCIALPLLLVGTASFFYVSRFNPELRVKALSHLQVSHGLFVSTHTAANAYGREYETALNRASEQFAKERAPNPYIFLAESGLKVIREEPTRYLKNVWIRFLTFLFTPLFWKGMPGLWYSFFLVLGVALAWLYKQDKKTEIIGISILAGSLLFFMSFCFFFDPDVRYRIPIYLLFSLIAPYGWWRLFARIPFYFNLFTRREREYIQNGL